MEFLGLSVVGTVLKKVKKTENSWFSKKHKKVLKCCYLYCSLRLAAPS